MEVKQQTMMSKKCKQTPTSCLQLISLFYRMPLNLYEKLSEETLDSLTDQIDRLLEETYPHEFDVSFSVSKRMLLYIINLHLVLNRMEY